MLAALRVRIPAFIGSNNAENNTCPGEDAGERSTHGFAWAATHGFVGGNRPPVAACQQ
jgi:hypothetical protein